MKKITLQDLADEFNVSKVTISKALNDKDDVSENLKKSIKQRADELGYRINASARSLKNSLKQTIGVVVAERFMNDQKSFYINMYGRLIKAIAKLGCETIIHILYENEEQNGIPPNMYKNQKVDGIILLGQLNENYTRRMSQLDIPILMLDNYFMNENIDSVTTDNMFSSLQITNYLFDTNHKDLIFVGDIKATSSIQDRFLGFLKSHIIHNVAYDFSKTINDRDKNGRFIPLSIPDVLPDAFVCNCDVVAYYLIKQLKDKGYRVPEDVSVVGFDGDLFSTISTPQITTVVVDVDAMTTTCAKFIIKKIKNPYKEYGRVFVKGKIRFADSVKQNK